MRSAAVVLLFAEDPGAANFVGWLSGALAEQGIEPVVLTSGAAGSILAERGVRAEPWPADAGLALERHGPAGVIVGTAVDRNSPGLQILRAARERGLRTVGVVDAVKSAAWRFRGETKSPIAHAPELIVVPEDAVALAFERLGVDPRGIVVAGNPQWLAAARRSRIPRNSTSKAPVVVFVAEPPVPAWIDQGPCVSDFTGWSPGTERGQAALEETLDALKAVAPKAQVVLRLHPRNDRDVYGRYAASVAEVSATGPVLDVLENADLCIGLTSSPLAEASVMGIPAISLALSENDLAEVPRPPGGGIEQVTSRRALADAIVRALAAPWQPPFAADELALQLDAAARRVARHCVAGCA
jgi:hypothetical protein